MSSRKDTAYGFRAIGAAGSFGRHCMDPIRYVNFIAQSPSTPDVPLQKGVRLLLDGIWGLLKRSWVVLASAKVYDIIAQSLYEKPKWLFFHKL